MISTGGEGKISGRKRVRGKIGNPLNVPELKHYNMLDNTASATDFYRYERVFGIYSYETSGDAGVWRPLMMRWPPLGTGSSGRIGKRIRVKYLRIKGYVAASPFLISQVRYRLVLYRVKKNFDQLGAEKYSQSWLSSLYNNYSNWELHPDASSSLIQKYATYNYYMSYFDPDQLKAQECKRRVLLKGLIKPSADVGNYTIKKSDEAVVRISPDTTASGEPPVPQNVDALTLPSGAGSVTHLGKYLVNVVDDIELSGEFQKHNTQYDINTEINMKSFFPIDLTVTMNDNVDVDNYRYVLVFESDWSTGQKPHGFYDNEPEYSNYFFVFTPQIYYTDD